MRLKILFLNEMKKNYDEILLNEMILNNIKKKQSEFD